jgi:hypothetical protein
MATVLELMREGVDYGLDLDEETTLVEFAELYGKYHASRSAEAHAALEDFFKTRLAVEAQ